MNSDSWSIRLFSLTGMALFKNVKEKVNCSFLQVFCLRQRSDANRRMFFRLEMSIQATVIRLNVGGALQI